MLGHLRSPRPVCPPQLCGCVLTGLGPKPLRQQHQDPSRLVWVLLLLLPLDVQRYEYSDFLFKTNLEFSLSKGLLITQNRLRQELTDRPTWLLLKNKAAIGRATDKGKRQGSLFMSY